MKYFIRGKKSINLTQNDFIAKGGEGQVFGKGKTIYKIYNEPSKMIPDAKIMELQALDRRNILKPVDVILNNKNTPVGFTMDWVKDTIPLCKLFTNDFRNRNNVTDTSTLELVENIKQTVFYVHQGKCLMVDGNEFNYLVDKKKLVTPYFIDVDSYQTANFPATAIMPSIRDWHAKIFSQLTDWFAFAIVSCQLFVGIHPFKGRHPKFKKNDIESRIKANVSIFNPDVRVPPAARDFSKIPCHYIDWFIDLFEKGKRSMPPALPGQIVIIPVKIKTINSTDQFEIKEIKTFDSNILWHCIHAGMSLTATQDKIYIDKIAFNVEPGTDVLFTPKQLTPVFAGIKGGKLKLECRNKTMLPFPEINADEKMVINNTLYVRDQGNLTEIEFEDVGNKVLAAVKNVWNIMPNSAEIFAGVIYQSVLGKPYLVIPVPQKDSSGSCIVKQVPELEKYRIIDAKHDSGVCILIGHTVKRYDRIVLKFDKKYDAYDCRINEDIDLSSVNFVTLEKGVVISVNDDDLLEIFSKGHDKPQVNQIKDPDINNGMRLCKEGNTVMFFEGDKLYELRMK
ncbi:hypothetical protein QUF70_08840 [Desulfobacterales bacterium HSG17]|nr:hypothetical protein [Desulfobacterales bacterium HSG17]